MIMRLRIINKIINDTFIEFFLLLLLLLYNVINILLLNKIKLIIMIMMINNKCVVCEYRNLHLNVEQVFIT